MDRILLVSIFARSRGVSFIWEQPSSSRLFKHGPVANFRERAPDCGFCALDMEAYGLLAEKKTLLFGNAPYLQELARRMSRAERVALRLRPDRLQVAERYVDGEGNPEPAGGPI